MKTLQDYLQKQINEQLKIAVLSSRRGSKEPDKVKIRPIELQGQVVYQASSFQGTKVFHKNYKREEMIAFLISSLEKDFGQLQAQGACMDGTVLVSKKGKITIKTKTHQTAEPVQIMAHNRVKQYILREGIPVPFLVDLGVMTSSGKVVSARYDKFRQINRFLEFIEDILPRLSKEREITILDF